MSRLSYNDRQRLEDVGALRPIEDLEQAILDEDYGDARSALDSLEVALVAAFGERP